MEIMEVLIDHGPVYEYIKAVIFNSLERLNKSVELVGENVF